MTQNTKLEALASLVRDEMDVSARRMTRLPAVLAESELGNMQAALLWLHDNGLSTAQLAVMQAAIQSAQAYVKSRAAAAGRAIPEKDPVAALNWICTTVAHREMAQIMAVTNEAALALTIRIEEAMDLLKEIGAQDHGSIGRIRYMAEVINASAQARFAA